MPRSAAREAASPVVGELLAWYGRAARELPWRSRDAGPWAVLVSEVMLQQTPVARVLPVYHRWLTRWPTASALAAVAPGEAVRAWGRLGYPRRALRLHAAAVLIAERHGDVVPSEYLALRALPGVGDYTAAAVAAFAFRQRHPVLDTNVRRVLARAWSGVAGPGPAATVAERQLADDLLPGDDELAATFSVALMELGALICRARAPLCAACPVAGRCAWRSAGYPASGRPARRSPGYEGTDRQARGAVLEVLRSAVEPMAWAELDDLRAAWTDVVQLDRALNGLVADGLVEPLAGARFRLPT
jgi:A/G-specific adenine glycosylase